MNFTRVSLGISPGFYFGFPKKNHLGIAKISVGIASGFSLVNFPEFVEESLLLSKNFSTHSGLLQESFHSDSMGITRMILSGITSGIYRGTPRGIPVRISSEVAIGIFMTNYSTYLIGSSSKGFYRNLLRDSFRSLGKVSVTSSEILLGIFRKF